MLIAFSFCSTFDSSACSFFCVTLNRNSSAFEWILVGCVLPIVASLTLYSVYGRIGLLNHTRFSSLQTHYTHIKHEQHKRKILFNEWRDREASIPQRSKNNSHAFSFHRLPPLSLSLSFCLSLYIFLVFSPLSSDSKSSLFSILISFFHFNRDRMFIISFHFFAFILLPIQFGLAKDFAIWQVSHGQKTHIAFMIRVLPHSPRLHPAATWRPFNAVSNRFDLTRNRKKMLRICCTYTATNNPYSWSECTQCMREYECLWDCVHLA